MPNTDYSIWYNFLPSHLLSKKIRAPSYRQKVKVVIMQGQYYKYRKLTVTDILLQIDNIERDSRDCASGYVLMFTNLTFVTYGDI